MGKKKKKKPAIGRLGTEAALALRSRKAHAHDDKREVERGEEKRRAINDSEQAE